MIDVLAEARKILVVSLRVSCSIPTKEKGRRRSLCGWVLSPSREYLATMSQPDTHQECVAKGPGTLSGNNSIRLQAKLRIIEQVARNNNVISVLKFETFRS